jgi:hypothetical protein
MQITDGIGLIQSHGGEITVIRPGDVIHTRPGSGTGMARHLTTS